MKEHLEETNARLAEVLEDVTSDPTLSIEKFAGLENTPALQRLTKATRMALVMDALEHNGEVDVEEALTAVFQLGFSAGVQFERRGYRL